MVGDSEWTEKDIIVDERIRHVELRIVNKETGEVYAYRAVTVANRDQRLEFILDYQICYEKLCAENPELLNAKVVFIASLNY